jgi:beta-glucosidase
LSPRTYRFPAGFLWGASTSSHQVEGDNRWNDWWEYEQRGQVPFRSGDACRQYELFERDFDLARMWHHNAHRFSIEWSRLEPVEGSWNDEAVAHYRQVIRSLRDRGLEPIVTLHHFTNPAWFTRRGGWLRSDSSKLFARYVERVDHELGDSVRFWVTINEPTVYAMQAYITGEWPPCEGWAWMKAARALRNLARAHCAAYRVLHRRRTDVMVGFAHSAPVVAPCDPARRRDRLAASLRDMVLNRAFFGLIAVHAWRLPENTALDFVGINYYTRAIVRSSGLGAGAWFGRVCEGDHHDRGPISTMGWEVYPAGLTSTLERFSRYGLPLLVTENGIATDDEKLRHEFVVAHLAALGQALDRGVNVIGYLYWSLIDNFEWSFGTRPKFGLAAVNFETQERLARPCADVFARACESRFVDMS